MTTNLEAAVAVLKSHRDARGWSDAAVATDLLAQLGLDATGNAKHAKPVVDPNQITEAEVVAHETAAQQAADKAKHARAQLTAQSGAEPTTASLPRSTDPLDLAPGTFDANAPRVPAPTPAAAKHEDVGKHDDPPKSSGKHP